MTVHIVPTLPDVEGAFLTGAQGARSWAHAAVHHLLPQVVDLGLKAAVFCIRIKKMSLLKEGYRAYTTHLGFNTDESELI